MWMRRNSEGQASTRSQMSLISNLKCKLCYFVALSKASPEKFGRGLREDFIYHKVTGKEIRFKPGKETKQTT